MNTAMNLLNNIIQYIKEKIFMPKSELQIKETDDSQFVTERLAAMSPMYHRLLSAWMIICSMLALWIVFEIWPGENQPLFNNVSLDSLKTEITKYEAKATVAKNIDSIKIIYGVLDTLKHRYTLDSVMIAANATMGDSTFFGQRISRARSQDGLRLLTLCFLFGVIGGATHGLSSLMDFRGQRRLFRSWTLWYFGRPILGGFMAVLFYVVLRAGLFSGDAPSKAANFYGVAAFSALVGLFTDAATNKLGEVFQTLFSTKTNAREGKLTSDAKDEDEPIVVPDEAKNDSDKAEG